MNKTLIVNFSTLDQALVNSTDAEIEAFVSEARAYAADNNIPFEVIRDIRKPAIFLSTDGETQDNELNDEADAHFTAICERL